MDAFDTYKFLKEQKRSTLLEPRWMVKFSKDGLTFVAKFDLMDDMIMACARATGAGYKIQTMPTRKAGK